MPVGGGFTQDSRFLSLTTPLGKDALLLNSFSVSERLSAPYIIELDVLSTNASPIDPKRLLGETIALRVAYGDLAGGARHFHGICRSVGIGGETERFRQYRLEVVPKLWLSTLTAKFRVFESKSVVQIVQQILGEYGIANRFDTGSYKPWAFCFQYKETDFNFISRLMEEAGLFYYFEHAAGNHTMVIADKPSAFKPCSDQASAKFEPDLGAQGADFVMTWEKTHELRSGAHGIWDWHFENAPTRQNAEVNTRDAVAGNTMYKVFDYPGRAVEKFNAINGGNNTAAELTALNTVRMEEIETENPVFTGMSTCRAFSAGMRFTLQGGPYPAEYAITAVDHRGSQYPPYLSGMESSQLYTNHMTAITYGAIYRPPRTARRALVPGLQTALITKGPDKYGRMRVKFHWGESVTSGWVRVAQRWAGPQWGTIFLPRVGHEVVVDFLDGDPDHPLIIGSVYNKQNMPPYSLPDKYTQSGIKTRSMSADGSSQGGAEEFNELRFEDLLGKEDIYFHAQKDFHRVVENDDDLKVGNNRTLEIEQNLKETTKQGNREIYVDKGNDKHQVKMGNREAIIDMGNDTLTVKMGNHIRKINLGKSETEAMQSITLKVGANKIVIDQAGITLDGIMIKIKGAAMIDSQAPMQKMNGDAMIMIKGGITMIN